MRLHVLRTIVGAWLVAGCGASDTTYREEQKAIVIDGADAAAENEFGFMEGMEQGSLLSTANAQLAASEAAASAATGAAETASEVPGDAQVAAESRTQIAYSYSYAFRIAADRIERLQQSHAAMCEKMGRSRCRVLNLSRAGTDDDGFGQLDLRVAASEARGFGGELAKAAEEAGGEQASFALDGEDLTETIIDTEAHLASRRLLRDRLMEVLRTRQGSVGDLVAAERAVAEANEELDAAASQLAQLRNRVRMSAVTIEYGPDVAFGPYGLTRPIADALGAIGTTLGVTIAAIVYIAVALIPIIPFILLLRWLWRRSGFRFRREPVAPAERPSA